MELVLNEATCMQTGAPVHNCHCRNHAGVSNTTIPSVNVVNSEWKPTPIPDAVVNWNTYEGDLNAKVGNSVPPTNGQVMQPMPDVNWDAVFGK